MAAITFAQFPRELRDMIWSAAAAAQFKYIAECSPTSSTVPAAAERLRQAFVGHENLPSNVERQPLRVHVNDYAGRTRYHAHDFEALVNRLPLASVCSEARSHAISFCREKIDVLDLHYTRDPPDVVGPPVSLGDEVLEHVLRPSVVWVTVSNQPPNRLRAFTSADHLVDIIDREFGSTVKEIVWHAKFNASSTLERIYWPHVGVTRERSRMRCLWAASPYHDLHSIIMTPDRHLIMAWALHFELDRRIEEFTYPHLLKFYELLDSCKQRQKLPHLQSFEIELKTIVSHVVLNLRLSKAKGVLRDDGSVHADWKDCRNAWKHAFFASWDDAS